MHRLAILLINLHLQKLEPTIVARAAPAKFNSTFFILVFLFEMMLPCSTAREMTVDKFVIALGTDWYKTQEFTKNAQKSELWTN